MCIGDKDKSVLRVTSKGTNSNESTTQPHQTKYRYFENMPDYTYKYMSGKFETEPIQSIWGAGQE